MNPTENQISLLRKLNGQGWARPGQCLTAFYRHPIGANNGLKGLVRAGLADHQTRFQKRGIRCHGGECLTLNVYQITPAGIAALAPVPQTEPVQRQGETQNETSPIIATP